MSSSQMQVESKYGGGNGGRIMYKGKRKASSQAGRPYEKKAPKPQYGPKPKSAYIDRQIKALIAGKRRDAADVTRNSAGLAATTISCLTSSTDFATAASGTGLLDVDGDECLVNSVRIQQFLKNACAEDATPVGHADAMVRTIVVYFKKPLLVASAAGTLPPVTEVLVTDSLYSMYVPDTQNAGRFTVLYDKTDNLHENTVAVAATGAYPRNDGGNSIMRWFNVKVNKKVHFKANAVSGTPAGHYDSDVSAGQVDTGLIVMYQLAIYNGGAPVSNCVTRLNYTG